MVLQDEMPLRHEINWFWDEADVKTLTSLLFDMLKH